MRTSILIALVLLLAACSTTKDVLHGARVIKGFDKNNTVAAAKNCVVDWIDPRVRGTSCSR
jgi:hypothetical protein